MLNVFSPAWKVKSRVENNWVTTLTPCITKHICRSLVPTFRGRPPVAPYPRPSAKVEKVSEVKKENRRFNIFSIQKSPRCITAGGGGCHITY